jgi:hypothetical protein
VEVVEGGFAEDGIRAEVAAVELAVLGGGLEERGQARGLGPIERAGGVEGEQFEEFGRGLEEGGVHGRRVRRDRWRPGSD